MHWNYIHPSENIHFNKITYHETEEWKVWNYTKCSTEECPKWVIVNGVLSYLTYFWESYLQPVGLKMRVSMLSILIDLQWFGPSCYFALHGTKLLPQPMLTRNRWHPSQYNFGENAQFCSSWHQAFTSTNVDKESLTSVPVQFRWKCTRHKCKH